jgi:hypothetical protein
MNIIFFTLAGLYFIVASKVYYWITIDQLGFGSQCPLLFLRNEKPYHYACWILFGGAAASLFGFTLFNPWIDVGVLAMLWGVSRVRGEITAIKKYREKLGVMCEEEPDPVIKRKWQKDIEKSNNEILQKKTLTNTYASRSGRYCK